MVWNKLSLVAGAIGCGVLLSLVGCEEPVTAVQDPKELARRAELAAKIATAGATSTTSNKSKKPRKAGKQALQRFEAQGLGLSLRAPKTWSSKTVGDSLVFVDAKSGEGDFQENLNVSKKVLREAISTEEYYQKTLQSLRMLRDFKVKRQGDLKRKKGRPIKYLHYTYNLEGQEVAGAAYVMVEAKTGIVVAGAATRDTFKTHRKLFESVAKSVKVEP